MQLFTITPIFFWVFITHVGGSKGVNTGPMKHWLPFLNTDQPHLNPRTSFLTTEHWLQIYSNQKEIKYISHSNIRASVETRPPKLHSLLRFSLPFHPWHFMGLSSPPPPHRAREFLIHVFLVMYFLCWLLSVCLQFYIKFLGNKTLHKESSKTLNWNLIASNKLLLLL